MSLCECGCGKETGSGGKNPPNRFIFNHHTKGKHHTVEAIRKISESHKGKHSSPETEFKKLEFYPIPSLCFCGCNEIVWNGKQYILGHYNRGIKFSEESKKKMSENNGMKRTENRLKVSREKSSSWKGGISFEPYCPKFNFRLKELVRETFRRTCVLCNKTEIDLEERLCVHHVLGNKNEGCDGIKFNLIPLCRPCHNKVHANEEQYRTELCNIYFGEDRIWK